MTGFTDLELLHVLVHFLLHDRQQFLGCHCLALLRTQLVLFDGGRQFANFLVGEVGHFKTSASG